MSARCQTASGDGWYVRMTGLSRPALAVLLVLTVTHRRVSAAVRERWTGSRRVTRLLSTAAVVRIRAGWLVIERIVGASDTPHANDGQCKHQDAVRKQQPNGVADDEQRDGVHDGERLSERVHHTQRERATGSGETEVRQSERMRVLKPSMRKMTGPMQWLMEQRGSGPATGREALPQADVLAIDHSLFTFLYGTAVTWLLIARLRLCGLQTVQINDEYAVMQHRLASVASSITIRAD